ncbi:FAD-dependent oxidoreductase [bacterium]|nr:MAG: FAD-dependent oxidoreductase [bacterium]
MTLLFRKPAWFVCLVATHPLLLSSCSQSGVASAPTNSASTSTKAATTATSASWQGTKVSTDVLVIGGTPSGVVAAIAAARQGAKVILVEDRAELGGDIVYAMLNMFDVPMRPNGTSPVAVGIFGEIYKPLGVAFDIKKARALLEAKVAAEPNITLWKRAHVQSAWKNGQRVTGAVIAAMPGKTNAALPASQVGVTAKAIIDASNDADFAARAGATSFVGRQAGGRDNKQQSVSLLFSIQGANWSKMEAYVRGVKPMAAAKRIGQEYASDVAPTTSKEVAPTVKQTTPQKPVLHRLGGVDGNYIWERGDVVQNYVPLNPNVLALSVNFGKQSDGSIILNTLNAINVNGLNDADKARARNEMNTELKSFIPYLRTSMPGLENITLGQIAPELYIRETRHLRALYELTVNDVRGQQKFPDRVALASYPLDLHPYEKNQRNPFGPKRYFYTIPLRATVPRDIDGVFVASRCLGATYEAAGSARVIPVTAAVGQACGVAAAWAAKKGKTPQQIAKSATDYGAIQTYLRESGADVGDQFPTS